MQRKSFIKLFLPAFGYAVMGNLLCTVMTVSVAVLIDVEFMKIVAAVLSAILFYLLVFTTGYKDGIRERKLFERKMVESVPKYRWIGIGFSVSALLIIPSVILLIDKLLNFGFDLVFFFRIANGAVFALSMLLGGNSTVEMPLYVPFIFMLFYMLIPVFSQLGYKMAFNDKISMDRIMYKK